MVCVVRIWLDGGDLLWNWTLEGVHVLNGCIGIRCWKGGMVCRGSVLWLRVDWLVE